MKNNITVLFLGILLLTSISCHAATKYKAKDKPKPQVTFVELGSVNCIPCKMMKPVMKAVEDEYKDKVQVVFYDVKVNKEMADKYKIRVIPTQVFLDNEGREFFRHEGFYPKEDIIKLIDKKIGITRKNKE